MSTAKTTTYQFVTEGSGAPEGNQQTDGRDDEAVHGRGAARSSKPTEKATKIELPAATRAELNKQLLSLIPSLRAFAHVLTRNHSEVDDLVQDTLVKAISNIHQFTPGTNLRAWLFTIERNTFYTAHQQRRRQATASLDDTRTLGVSPNQEWSVRVSAVHDAVLQLPAEQREALLLVAGAGMTYDEAAEVCQCALGTIKSRINRARHRLEELLDVEGTAFFEGANQS